MKYTAAQIGLLRHRLRAYHERNPGEGRQCLSWEEVSLDIADIGGTAVPPERLRQFVEGVSRKNGKGPSMLTRERLDAVRDFLLAPEVGLISEEEWEAKPQTGYITILVRIPLADVLENGSEALLSKLELEPLALILDENEDSEEQKEVA